METEEGLSPLSIACQNGRSLAVEVLLKDQRVNPAEFDQRGFSPVYYACEGGWEVLDTLAKDCRVEVWSEKEWGEKEEMEEENRKTEEKENEKKRKKRKRRGKKRQRKEK
jgi:ankyrin repeat protein